MSTASHCPICREHGRAHLRQYTSYQAAQSVAQSIASPGIAGHRSVTGWEAGHCIPPPLLRLVLTPGIFCLPSCDWFSGRVSLVSYDHRVVTTGGAFVESRAGWTRV
eukprot:4757295-Pyramimonas_sp.AAC.1